MSETKERLRIECPCCQSKLTVDPVSGLVLNHEQKKPEYSFEEAVAREKRRTANADDLFQQAVTQEQERSSKLEEKFEEALASKDELDDPVRPFDFD